MGKQGKRPSAKGFKATGVSISVGGLVTKNGKTAVKLRVGGRTVLVPAGGSDSKATAAEVRRRIQSVGDQPVASIAPLTGGKLKVGISGPNGSISFSGTLA